MRGPLYPSGLVLQQQPPPPKYPTRTLQLPPLLHISPSGQEGNKRIQKLAPILCFQFNY